MESVTKKSKHKEQRNLPVSSFDGFLYPVDSKDFMKQYWCKDFLYVEGYDSKYSDLLSWQMLNEILENHRFDYPRLRLAKDGYTVPPKEYTEYIETKVGASIGYVVPDKLYEQIKEGATLIIDAVDELCEPVKKLASVLESCFYETVHVNAYVGWGNTTALDVHWDDHDVFIVQVIGKKHWSIYGETKKFPIERTILSDLIKPTEPIWQKTISAGDLVYIPRGWWHNAVPCNEFSLHLTFGITNRNGIDYIKWMTKKITEDEFFRKDIPHLEDEKTLENYIEEFTERIGLLKQNFLREYLKDHQEKGSIRPRFSFPFAISDITHLDDNTKLVSSFNRKISVEEINGLLLFTYGGRKWKFDVSIKPVVDLLIATGQCSIHEAKKACCNIEDKTFFALVKQLIESGLVYLEEQ